MKRGGGIIMKKYLYLVLFSMLIALFSLITGISPALAASKQAAGAQRKFAVSMRTAPIHFQPGSWQEHSQLFHGTTYTHIHLTFQGHNQNNTGNQGYNRGYNQNFGNNGGNMVTNHGRASQYQRTRQSFYGTSYSESGLKAIGYNQNNTGNQGVNDGYNEDHGGNAGNQIVN
jgi:hypothetical protein